VYVIMATMSDPAAVDIRELATLLHDRRKESGLSLREVAAETGVPFTTLARVETGKIPDLTTFRNIVLWLGIPPDRFFPTPRLRQESTPEAIAYILRHDPALTEEARNRLSSLLAEMYATLTVQAQAMRVNLRAQRAFTPEAGSLLANLLKQMQDKLAAEDEQ
jgi:transcriptional regulator with XRE-family HTH domain